MHFKVNLRHQHTSSLSTSMCVTLARVHYLFDYFFSFEEKFKYHNTYIQIWSEFLTNVFTSLTETPVKIQNITITPIKFSHVPFYSVLYSFLPRGNHLFYHRLVVSVVELHKNGIIQCVLFYIRLLLLSIMIWAASTLLLVSIVYSFSLPNFILLYEFNMFIDSLTDRHLRCFRFWLLRIKLLEYPRIIYLFVDVGFISLG